MTKVQHLVTTFLPSRWAASIRRESEQWQMRCLTCGNTRTMWEAGGIRWGAASAEKRTVVYCPECQMLRAMAVEKRPEVERRSF